MADATVVVTVNRPDQVQTFSCNGIPEERAAARAEFDKIMKSRQYFAFVETAPGRGEQVRSFDEIEKLEKQLGTVNVNVQPALQGG